jgi:D-alanyl-lipoteichoic acid acyltransferase DltB (MBOAT superfamily)
LIPTLLLFFSVLTVYLFFRLNNVQSISLERKKLLFFEVCLLVVLPFLVIKYLFPGVGWLGGWVGSEWLSRISNSTSEILLPAGISFYTFQLLSSVIDTKGKEEYSISFVEVLGFASFFPWPAPRKLIHSLC